MAVSAGTAYVDILPNMSKFAPALAGASRSSTAMRALGGAGLALGAGLAVSVKMATDFEQSMRNVNSIAKLSEGQFKGLSEDVLALAGPTAQAPKTLADGLYDLVSSGFDAKESLTILEASAKAATAGLTTTDVATKGVAAVLNAYRLPASKAAQVSDQLFRTVDQGVISFDELSTGIGDTLPFASSLGVGLEEVGAATATMTKQGLSSSETFTRIRNLMQTMIKPGEELSGAFESLGYENGEALIKAEGFQGALEKIVGTTDGSKDAIAALFPNIRSLGGALALTGKNAASARKDLDALKDSAGATDEAFKEQSKSLAIQFQELKSRLSVLAIEIGSAIIPVLNDVVRFLNEDFGPAFTDVKNTISDVVGPIADAVGPAIAKLGPLFDVARFAAEKLFAVFSLNAKLGAAAIGVIIDVVAKLGSVLGDIAGVAADAFGGLKDAAGAVGDLFDGVEDDMKLAAGSVRGFNSAISGMGNAVSAGVAKATGGFKKYEKQVAATMADVGRSAALAIGQIIPQFRKVGERMARAVADGIKSAGKGAIDAAKILGGQAGDAARNTSPKWAQAGQTLGRTLAQGISASRGSTSGAGSAIAQAAAAAARSTAGAFFAAGKAMGDSLAAGIRAAIAGVNAAVSAINAAASNIKPPPHRAAGGPVAGGTTYLVGELGPELFTPKQSGYIVPNNRLAAAPGISGGAGQQQFVITNWQKGTGYFASIADDAVNVARTFDGQRQRMRT